ncbi:MAG: bifunctional 2-polyprenyl-6-hydroxyphenol methylase/3-demethylubiquinol 3-O-methyltransferase UbiG [Alphaproteobacteria bacterium TMED89]|nr:bifunctional 3-demethylubiquinol 3-O-methyltransferase/2-polyprenyl-6-hydroxyphenol methylase [Rhodospirillaceae bacterium]RPH12811.1 MAG: bifunctional 2-polyprenyl-6-hydroxyphenol methylase/3-demethylubiquinol 3-O-methyltransferase UbiG [Alphaproteobacteria bacterium TMED89]
MLDTEQTSNATGHTVDPAEVEKFTKMAESCWDPQGDFRPLHKLNPTRIRFLTEQIARHYDRDLDTPRPFQGLRVLDVGCGGGLVCEPLARLGAEVTGVDATPANIPVAQIHAEQMGLDIDYRVATVAELVEAGERFDVVLALEIIEHVNDPPAFVADVIGARAAGGLVFMSTFNKTIRSFALGIVAAEYVLQWLPKGTHDWQRFVAPAEMFKMVEAQGLRPERIKGFMFNPLLDKWMLTDDTGVSYIACFTSPLDNPPTEPEFAL